MSDPRYLAVEGKDLVGVQAEDCPTCPACGGDTETNERGLAFCPECAERFRVPAPS